ncbi:uncharacterized protein LOC121856216 isoform X2 [Homarus americanus]|uniref:uncharacterized protein LOC121856216 isoform X2 n=1 Tax=Homarus americanus TaxID=6706 RepID=UPI001C452670|nr:uncharacterized protein LOC121856216 isoform X2 [Homarus americanus]
MIYENLRASPNEEEAAAGLPGGVDVTEPGTCHPPCDSPHTTVWLSDSWKYNTIKRAPDFNIFEFSDVDSNEEKLPGNPNKQQPNPEKEKKRFRTKLPTFGRKKDKENKSKADSPTTTRQGMTCDNKRTYKHPDGPESPVSIHKAKISRPLASPSLSSVSGEGARSRDPSPYSSDNESRTSRGSSKHWRDSRREEEELWSGCSTDSWSCVSPLISPSPSLRSHQHPDEDPPSPSTPQLSLKSDEEGSPAMSPSVHKRDSLLYQHTMGSLEKVGLVEHTAGHAHHHKTPSGVHNPSSRPVQYPLPTTQGPTSTLQSTPSTQIHYTQPEYTRHQKTSTKYTRSQDANTHYSTPGEVVDQVPFHYQSLPQLHPPTHDSPTTPPHTNAPDQLSSVVTKQGARHQVPTVSSKRKTRIQGVGKSQDTRSLIASAQGSTTIDPKQKVKAQGSTTVDSKQRTRTQVVSVGEKNEKLSQIPTVGLKQDTRSQVPTVNRKRRGQQQGVSVDLKKDSRSHLPTLVMKQETRSRLPVNGTTQRPRSKILTVEPKQETTSQIPTIDSKQKERGQVTTVGCKQEARTLLDSVDHTQYKCSPFQTDDPKWETCSQLPTFIPKQVTCSKVPNVGCKREACSQVPTGDKQKIYSDLPLDNLKLESYSMLLAGDQGLEEMAEDWLGGGVSSRTSWCSGTISSTATSPILPPLPPGLFQDTQTSPPQHEDIHDDTFPENNVNLTSVCILSLDLTVDCKDVSGNGLTLVNITDNKVRDPDVPESKTDDEDECESREDLTVLSLDNNDDDPEGGDTPTEEIASGSRPLSASSGSVCFDEKYYEKDDYDSPEGEVSGYLKEEEDKIDDGSVYSASRGHSDDSLRRSKNTTPTINEEGDDDDFIDIDCDVQPMETLKRPLVYGYGRGPVRTRRGSTFLEKRLSQASDVSDYIEMDLLESLIKGRASNESVYLGESCLDLKETYWDHWQAKKGAEETHKHTKPKDPATSRLPNCPSSKFCYDPEVLLAQVRCPKSLEDATFKQYSAYVKSHIYDHFGNVHEGLKEYGLSYSRPGWISSQPELPDLPRDRIPGMFPLDYSSEPELSISGERRQPRPGQTQHLPQHAPPLRPPPLTSRDASLDSGTWTYLPSSETSPLTCHPVPLPRSTSSLSHIGPGVYNPWHHFLPDVTPPRTPRHSGHYTTGGALRTSSPCGSRPASPSPSRCSLTSRTSESHPHQENKWEATSLPTTAPLPPKKSFLPNLSSVMRSPLKKQNLKVKDAKGGVLGRVTGVQVNPAAPLTQGLKLASHQSIQNRRLTNISSKSSSSSSSSSSASSKDSVKTVIRVPPRSKGAKWLMKHFGDNKITRGMTAV